MRIISLMALLWTGGGQDRINNAKTGRRSNSKNRKYRKSITAYVKEKAMNSKKWFIAFRQLWLILIFSFSAFRAQD